MTYTALHHSRLTAHANDSQRDSARDGGLALILTELQGNRCFDCGNVAPLEFAHFVRANGRTSRDMGVIGAMACRACNLIHDIICSELGTDGMLPLEYLMADGRADRIITEYPTRKECAARWAQRDSHDSLVSEAHARLARL